MGMVGMVVRKKHGIDMQHVSFEALIAQVARGIDEDGGLALTRGSLDQRRTAPPAVFGVAPVGRAPLMPDAGYATRRPGSKKCEAIRQIDLFLCAQSSKPSVRKAARFYIMLLAASFDFNPLNAAASFSGSVERSTRCVPNVFTSREKG